MKRRTLGAMLGTAALAGMFAVAGAPASATKPDAQGEHKVWVCHATSGQGELKNGYNLIEVDIASTQGQAHLAHAETDPKNNSTFGVLYDLIDVGPNSDCGGVPPEPPAWTPPTYPPFTPEACTDYRLEKSTSTWDGETGTWSEWTDWPDAGPLAWGVVPDPRTGHHGGTHEADGDRHFAYVVTHQRPITDGECGPPELIEVTPSVEYTPPDCFAEGTVVLSEGEGYTWTENEDGTYTAVADEGYVIVGDDTFGPYETDQLTGRQCRTRPPRPPLPPLPIEAIPVDPSVTDPTCDAPGTVVLPTSPVGYDWVLQPDGSYVAVADLGYYFDLAAVTTFDPGDLSQLDGAVCEAPTSSVASEPPVAPPAVDPQAVAPPAQVPVAQTAQLPSTGSSSWTLALIALVTLLVGTGLVRLSRRRTD